MDGDSEERLKLLTCASFCRHPSPDDLAHERIFLHDMRGTFELFLGSTAMARAEVLKGRREICCDPQCPPKDKFVVLFLEEMSDEHPTDPFLLLPPVR
jgi:hypothetical protein